MVSIVMLLPVVVRLVLMVGVLGVVPGLRRTLRISRSRSRATGRRPRALRRVGTTCTSTAATSTLRATTLSLAGSPCAVCASSALQLLGAEKLVING